MTKLDVIVDLQYGDTGKGKVAHFLCTQNKYTHVIRYNGGANAGHTIYHNGVKFVTHQVPVGVFYGIRSIIGSGCVVDPSLLLDEVRMLESAGIRVKGKLFVARNAHVVTEEHKKEDAQYSAIGTTKRGIGQAYRDKYARTGIRAEKVRALKPYLIDTYEEFKKDGAVVLGEGAQGFGLDIDWGEYPFITSSHCTTAGALLNGFAPRSIRSVWGVAKVYETRVGGTLRPFEPNKKIFHRIREVGEEYGATTGRPRLCNWIDLDLLERAIKMNGVTDVVFSKMDVLDTVGVWKVRKGRNRTWSFKSGAAMRNFIEKHVVAFGVSKSNIHFSVHKDKI